MTPKGLVSDWRKRAETLKHDARKTTDAINRDRWEARADFYECRANELEAALELSK